MHASVRAARRRACGFGSFGDDLLVMTLADQTSTRTSAAGAMRLLFLYLLPSLVRPIVVQRVVGAGDSEISHASSGGGT